MGNKGMFAGWKDVYSFTATQNIKGSSYKMVTILLGIVVAILFGAISVIMAVMQLDDSEKIDVKDDFTKNVSTVYYVENDIVADENMNMLINAALSLDGVIDTKITVSPLEESKINDFIGADKTLIIALEKKDKKDDKAITIKALTPSGDEDKKDIAEEYLEYVSAFIDLYGSTIAGVAETDIEYFMVPYVTHSSSVNDDVENVGVMLTNTLVPMLISMLLFTMIILYGQNVTKSVVAEKSSKLMEMLLTAVRPYALIAGKVLAIVSLAICQVSIWIACGFVGYKLGGIVATGINPDYVNYLDAIIDMMATQNGANAFKWYSFIIAFVFVVAGFLMFSVIAALIAATISKLEDLSTGMTLFQFPVMVGWLLTYCGPIITSDFVHKLTNYLPISSPFSVPGSVILGQFSVLESIISLMILIITTVTLVLITGKVYKGKLFNRK